MKVLIEQQGEDLAVLVVADASMEGVEIATVCYEGRDEDTPDGDGWWVSLDVQGARALAAAIYAAVGEG